MKGFSTNLCPRGRCTNRCHLMVHQNPGGCRFHRLLVEPNQDRADSIILSQHIQDPLCHLLQQATAMRSVCNFPTSGTGSSEVGHLENYDRTQTAQQPNGWRVPDFFKPAGHTDVPCWSVRPSLLGTSWNSSRAMILTDSWY